MGYKLRWKDLNLSEDGHRVYRSTTEIDPDDLPVPLAVLGPDVTSYDDTTALPDVRYFYRVSAFVGAEEAVSLEVDTDAAQGDPHWDKVVSLLHFDGDLVDERGGAYSLYAAGIIDTTNPIFGTGSLSNTARGGAVGPVESIDTNDSWTIEGYIFCTDNAPLNFIYTSRQDGQGSRACTLYFGDGDALTFQIFDPSGTFQIFSSSAPHMPLNETVHVAVTFDKPTNTLRLFQAGAKVYEGVVTTFWTKTRRKYLACWPHTNQPTRYLRGRLDDWRETLGVVRYTEDFTPPTGPFPNFGPFSPKDIATELWLDAADSSTITTVSGGISEWRDKSGNARHASQGTSTRRPTLLIAEQNGKNVIRFDGSDDALIGAAFVPNTFSAFVVAKRRNPATDNFGWFSQNNNTNNSGRLILFTERDNGTVLGAMQIGTHGPRSGARTGAFSQWAYTRNGTAGSIFRDGDVGDAVTVGAATIQNVSYALGSDNNTVNSSFSDHDICEIVFVSGVIPTQDRQKIEGYLAHKWGLVDKLPVDHPYKHQKPMKSPA